MVATTASHHPMTPSTHAARSARTALLLALCTAAVQGSGRDPLPVVLTTYNRQGDDYFGLILLDYLALGMIYLRDNPLLREPLRPEHVKDRLLGHWGTTPGLNFIYVHLNRVIKQGDLEVIYRAGPRWARVGGERLP